MFIGESYKAFKRNDFKVGYKINWDGENGYFDRRSISKILKLDENTQYGFAIPKPMAKVNEK